MQTTDLTATDDDARVGFVDTRPAAPPAMPSPIQPAPAVQHSPGHSGSTPSTRQKPARRPATPGLYERVGTSVALLVALAIGVGLWIAGAYFTLRFLESLGLRLGGLGGWQWLIPLGISSAELFLWPRRGTRVQQVVVFMAVLAFDVGSTYAGMVDMAAGRTVQLFAGITIPHDGPLLVALGLGSGLLFAFGPEKLWKWAVTDLIALWR